MSTLKPWTHGLFELLLHAEIHRTGGEDFDRRMALISFDNAIEVAISTFLSLNPIQRCWTPVDGGGSKVNFPANDIKEWNKNYHTKLDFMEWLCGERSLPTDHEKADIIYFHEIRNGQYHAGGPTIPEGRVLNGIREAAIWVFCVLYDFDKATLEQMLEDEVKRLLDNGLPIRDKNKERIIDSQHGMVSIAGRQYYTSEALYGVDPDAYSDLLANLDTDEDDSDAEVADE